jgi:hypothetical protein
MIGVLVLLSLLLTTDSFAQSLRNPYAKPEKVLGQTEGDYATAKALVVNYLKQNDDKSEVPVAAIRALHPLLQRDRIWNLIKDDLGIRE